MRSSSSSSGGQTDCLVIGGGAVGLATAVELARRRAGRVTLVERGAFGGESTHAAGGMLAPQAEADDDDDFFRFACAARDRYPAYAETLRAEIGVDIELDRTGTLYLALTEHDEEELARRHDWQRRAALEVEHLRGDEARRLEPHVSAATRAALVFPRDTQVEPRRLTAALVAAAKKLGVRLAEGVEVDSLIFENDAARGARTARGEVIAAGAVVVAAGAWSARLLGAGRTSGNRASSFAPHVAPVRGQMLSYEARPPLVRHVVYSPRGYLIPRRDNRLLAGSTTEHVGFRKETTAAGLRQIADRAAEIAPDIARRPLIGSWAGLRPGTRDELPLIGASSAIRNLYYATGHYRNGILLAPLTAEVIADLILGAKGNARSPLADLAAPFAPERRAAMKVEEVKTDASPELSFSHTV